MDAETSSATAGPGVGVGFPSSKEISENFLVRASPTDAYNSSYCWYQGGDHTVSKKCTIAASIKSKCPSGPGETHSLEKKGERKKGKVIALKIEKKRGGAHR